MNIYFSYFRSNRVFHNTVKYIHWIRPPIVALFLSFLIIYTCHEPVERNRDTTIHLEAVDSWTTSINLKVSAEDSTRSWAFALSRNDSIVLTASVITPDTVVTDYPLEPGREYAYRAYWLKKGFPADSSNQLLAATMDTTSHDFTWEIDTLGNHLSYLRDAAIIDENNIWVVGNIETDSGRFNAAHWDGDLWKSVLINAPGVIGEGILYFDEDDIWVATGIVYHWNGIGWERYHLWNLGVLGPEDGGVEHAWGTSSSNIYFVGRKGTIVHYNGVMFKKLDSPNDSKLEAVSGNHNGDYVFAAGHDYYVPPKTTALMIRDGVAQELYYSDYLLPQDDKDLGAVTAVDVYGDTAYFVTYQGFWKYNYITGESVIDESLERYQYHSLEVQARNDIFMIGGGFKYVHFNGMTWDFNNTLFDAYQISTFGGAFKGNIAVIAGYTKSGPLGIVAIGKR